MDFRQILMVAATQGGGAVPIVLGNELVQNGNFTSSTGWTLVNNSDVGGSVQITGGQLVFTNANLFSDAHTTALETLTAGSYRVTFTIVSRDGGNVRAVIGGSTGTLRTAVGTYTEDIVTTATNQILMIQGGSVEVIATIDDFSVKRIN